VFVDPKECLLVVSRLEHLASDIGGKSHSERCCAVDEGEGVSWQVACRTDGVQNADHSGQQCVGQRGGMLAQNGQVGQSHRPFGCETGMFDQRI
jgi:hypothetical protein